MLGHFIAAYPNLLFALVVLLGAVFGSFVSALSYRLPRGEPIGKKRSRCPNCETALGIKDLVPLFSWISAGGRCRYCAMPISWRYPGIECAAAILFSGIYYVSGPSLAVIPLFILGICILTLIVTDFEHYIIPDSIQIMMLLTGVFWHLILNSACDEVLTAGIIGLAIGLSLHYGYYYFRGKHGLGLGDVKLLGVAGVWLGTVSAFPPYLFFSGLLGILTALIWQWMGRGPRFPFGPALALTLLLQLLFPNAAESFWKESATIALQFVE